MSETASKTRELLEKLASTQHRRSLTADRIFRQLRQEEEQQRQDRIAKRG